MIKPVFVVDGIVKLLGAGALLVFLPGLREFLTAPTWILITAAVLLFLSAATEISYGVNKGARTYLKHIVIADAVIVLSGIIAIVIAATAQSAGGNPLAGYLWFAAIGVASLALAIVFTTGANGPDFREED